MELIHQDLTEKLRRCIFDVHNTVGVGYDEESYHQALIRRFHEEGDIPFVSEERKWILHRNLPVKMFKLDLLAFDKVILLLKCIQSDFIQPNYIQMISELKLWQKRLGLMVNVGLPKANIKRIPFENSVILGVTALQQEVNYEITTMQTYLKALGLSVGLLVNFGKSKLEIRGIKA